jgi:hypothetical protein
LHAFGRRADFFGAGTEPPNFVVDIVAVNGHCQSATRLRKTLKEY